MNTPIIAQDTAPAQAPRQQREKECIGCGQFGHFAGYACPACTAAARADGPPAPRKATRLPKVAGESWAAEVARKGAQARLNGCRITNRVVTHLSVEVYVTSQTGAGGYLTTLDTVSGEYSCKCEAWESGKCCPHVALLRTDKVVCPVCSGPAVVYVDAQDRGAVCCLHRRCLRADLTADETDALFDTLNLLTDRPILIQGLLLIVAQRSADSTAQAVA